MQPTIDSELTFNPSDNFRQILSQLRDKFDDVPSYTENDELTLKDIQWIFDHRKNLPVPFHKLMRETDLSLPFPVFPQRSKELDARIQKYKAQEADREYRKMTANVSGSSSYKNGDESTSESLSQLMKEVNRQVIVVFQFVITVVTSFIFGYSAPYYLYGIVDVNFRLSLGLVFGFVVAVADLYFVIKYMLEVDGVIHRGPKEKNV
ncbi:TMEM199 [Lepeophtheirus salmonis]|uniref:TMEM199 n=1 Tax=Lepeophtheirus salmonis TaxID=72036 RepID=D3PJA2_LEPSM|nr:Transmembrane protein 199 [Lepeophtheirus salmonis]CAB4061531.1 TMEM199 [Lepeophtheirus salmonis]CAF2886350.1 TMEM199 [Lepeophtheirus salmonis]